MEIRDAVDSDWAAVWGFLHQIVAAGDTYCWPPDTSEGPHERGGWASPAAAYSSPSTMVQSWEPPSFIRISRLLAVMSRTQASWCRRPQPAGVSGVPLHSAYSKSRQKMGTRRCSSTLSLRPTSTQSACGSRSASQSSPPSRKLSGILTVGSSAFTSCTSSCDSHLPSPYAPDDLSRPPRGPLSCG